ncbi:hypothetical protein ABZ946_34715 [Streptomyces sp. NPDC046324]|uniref:hypothetical protein n=1 Tax=Streptomyces sp. NPDC046324 TaxID=3154915 RepID=UPI003406E3E4
MALSVGAAAIARFFSARVARPVDQGQRQQAVRVVHWTEPAGVSVGPGSRRRPGGGVAGDGRWAIGLVP